MIMEGNKFLNTAHMLSCREGSTSLQCGKRGHTSGAGWACVLVVGFNKMGRGY